VIDLFGFLKKKLGDVVKKFSKEVEEESVVVDEVTEEESKEESKSEKSEKVKKKEDKKSVKKKEDKTEEPITQDIELKEKESEVELKEAKKKIEVKETKKAKEKDKEIKQAKQEDLAEEIKEKELTETILVQEEADEEKQDELEPSTPDVSEEPVKRGFFSKFKDTFTKIKLSDEKFEELFWDLEIALLENNVAMEVIHKIKYDLKNELTQDKISRKNTQEIILDSLRKSIEEVLSVKQIDFLKNVESKKPYVIAVIGVNGSGKTTTIAKLCNYLKKQNKTMVLAAADTFRAAAIQQIEHHANALDVKLIKHDYNSDPSAVAFDAIRHAEAKKLDVVVIDTAGRLHSNDNLMNELKNSFA
jgi:fused signal recognition particle receptor